MFTLSDLIRNIPYQYCWIRIHVSLPSRSVRPGDKGHRIVAILADQQLTDQAREEVRYLFPAGTTLADAAVWPDKEGWRITELDRLHHVSIPDDAGGYDQERDCKPRNYMFEALNWFTALIADARAPSNCD
jgi:hypothetical protein